jgi:hypothetical protein
MIVNCCLNECLSRVGLVVVERKVAGVWGARNRLQEGGKTGVGAAPQRKGNACGKPPRGAYAFRVRHKPSGSLATATRFTWVLWAGPRPC